MLRPTADVPHRERGATTAQHDGQIVPDNEMRYEFIARRIEWTWIRISPSSNYRLSEADSHSSLDITVRMILYL